MMCRRAGSDVRLATVCDRPACRENMQEVRALVSERPIEAGTSAGAETALGTGGISGVGFSEVHVQSRLLIGDVFARRRCYSCGKRR